jgi:hypothetical protein
LYYEKFRIQLEENNKHFHTLVKNPDLLGKFNSYLNSGVGMFNADVFSFYTANKERMGSDILPEHVERLKSLILNTVLKYNFTQANITSRTISDNSSQIFRPMSIYIFDTIIPLLSEFEIPEIEYRQKLIRFIPFSINNNESKHIYALLGDLSKDEKDILIQFYRQKRSDDLFNVNFSNFHSFCRNYKPLEMSPIIREFISSTILKPYQRGILIDLLFEIDNSGNNFHQIFDKYSESTDEEEFNIALLANSYLIKIGHIEAINWRLNIFLKKLTESNLINNDIFYKYVRGSNLDKVSGSECFELYLQYFQNSINQVNRGEINAQIAINFWNILFAYFENLASLKSLNYFRKIETIISASSKFHFYGALKEKFEKLKRVYLISVQKPSSFVDCIKNYNTLKERSYLQISTSNDLNMLISDILDKDIRNWIENEGAYKQIDQMKGKQEDLIQKTILTQFENCLLIRGFRPSETRIKREEQTLDDKRTDFTISYGFIGQVLIETKRASSTDISPGKIDNYKEKLLGYLTRTKSESGFFLIINTSFKTKNTFDKRINFVKSKFDNTPITVIGIDSNI